MRLENSSLVFLYTKTMTIVSSGVKKIKKQLHSAKRTNKEKKKVDRLEAI